MGRVSLTEDYDDRSVISKLNEMDKRVKENTTVVTSAEASARQSAQAAQETADRFAGSVGAVVQNANAQINASKAQVDQAKAEVDATVTTVAQAVQTANDASASAQASAQTVAGYEDRVTALETADGQNVKINRINEYAVGLTGNQLNIAGDKSFIGSVKVNFLRTIGADGYRRINIDRSDDEIGVAPAATVLYPLIAWNDKNNNLMSAIYVAHSPDGTTSISVQTRNSDGTIKYTTLAKGDVI